jgi:hypothetical protein
MITIDGYELHYPDDNIARRFKLWLLANREVERAFIEVAMQALKEDRKVSGYAIVQFIRAQHQLSITNDYGPILSRLAAAKHPQLRKVFDFKKTGWGKQRTTPDDTPTDPRLL